MGEPYTPWRETVYKSCGGRDKKQIHPPTCSDATRKLGPPRSRARVAVGQQPN